MRLRHCAVPLAGLTAAAAIAYVAGCAGQTSGGFPDDGGSSSGSTSSGSSSGFGGNSSGSSTSSGSTSSSGSPFGGSTSGSSSGTASSTSSSGTASSTSSSGTASSTSSSGGVTSGACAPASTGGLALAMNFLAAPANPGTGGYAFSYQDTVGSDVCLDGCPASGAVCTTAPATSMLCTHGDLLANPAPYTAFGGGIGFNLNQAMATSATPTTAMPFVTTGSGISYTVSSVPVNGLRLQIDHGGMTYCAPITTASGVIPWANLELTCYNTPPGAALTGPPADATQIEFQMVTVATAGTGDFCVTAVGFAP